MVLVHICAAWRMSYSFLCGDMQCLAWMDYDSEHTRADRSYRVDGPYLATGKDDLLLLAGAFSVRIRKLQATDTHAALPMGVCAGPFPIYCGCAPLALSACLPAWPPKVAGTPWSTCLREALNTLDLPVW